MRVGVFLCSLCPLCLHQNERSLDVSVESEESKKFTYDFKKNGWNRQAGQGEKTKKKELVSQAKFCVLVECLIILNEDDAPSLSRLLLLFFFFKVIIILYVSPVFLCARRLYCFSPRKRTSSSLSQTTIANGGNQRLLLLFFVFFFSFSTGQ